MVRLQARLQPLLALFLVACLFLQTTEASLGDRLPEFRDCVKVGERIEMLGVFLFRFYARPHSPHVRMPARDTALYLYILYYAASNLVVLHISLLVLSIVQCYLFIYLYIARETMQFKTDHVWKLTDMHA